MRKLALVVIAVTLGSFAFFATPAYAAVCTTSTVDGGPGADGIAGNADDPPDTTTTTCNEVAEAEKILAKFGDQLVKIVTALAANTWVLALFGLGIAFAIARRILSRGERKVSRGVV